MCHYIAGYVIPDILTNVWPSRFMGLETFEVKVTCFFNTSGTIYPVTQCHIPEVCKVVCKTLLFPEKLKYH